MKTNTTNNKKQLMKEKYDKLMKYNKKNLSYPEFNKLTENYFFNKIDIKLLLENLKGFTKDNFETFWVFITTYKILINEQSKTINS